MWGQCGISVGIATLVWGAARIYGAVGLVGGDGEAAIAGDPRVFCVGSAWEGGRQCDVSVGSVLAS